MSEPFIAQITLFAGNFPIRGWAYCSGQLLSIAQNTALFSLVGTIYGGDGQSTFGLPDLRGRVPRGSEGNSAGPGLPPVQLGQKGGVEQVTLTTQQLPSHSHSLKPNAAEAVVDQTEPEGQSLAVGNFYSSQAAEVVQGPVSTNNTGGGQSINVLNPYVGLNYLIALVGIFPSQN